MGIDLEALANDLRAAGCSVYPDDPKQSPWKGDGDYCQISVNNRTKVTDQGDLLAFGFLDVQTIAIIARHLGAGPVASDRAALVERVDRALDWIVTDGEDRDRAIDAALAAVEAAGWGPRAEPVAPPEPLSAGELDVCAKAVAGLAVPGNEELIYVDPDYLSDYLRPIVCSVLAALPARFAVPVEGA